MFRKLRLRLTFFNASVIAVLFVLLTSGTYLYVNSETKERSFFFLSMVAEDIRSDRFPGKPPFPRHEPPPEKIFPNPPGPPGPPRPLVFYVKTDDTGQINFMSDTIPLEKNTLQQLTRLALLSSNQKGELSFEQKPYAFVVVPQDLPGTHIVVFEDFENQLALLHLLITGLIVIGIFCLVLSLFGSFFMAHRAMKPILTAWQQQKDFVADASHELRSPLAVIQANLDIVRDNPVETIASQSKWLENVQAGVSGMAALVDSLLFLARHDAKQMPMQQKMFPFTEAVKSEIETLLPVLQSKSLRWETKVDGGISLVGDESRLRQVLRILLDNAIRHTPPDGMIRISLCRETQTAVLTVENTGEGIAPEHLNKVFERFYQVDRSRSKGGAGLGLAIARCIVNDHNGSITAKSSKSTGAAFIVRLPCK